MFHSGWHQHLIWVILTELRADVLAVKAHAEPLVNMSSLTNVNVLCLSVCVCVCVSSQEPSVMTEDDNGSDNSQFTGSTINLQDLE